MPRRILVVDDSHTIREIIKVYLMGKEYEVLDAADGARALQLARLMSLSLVIADISMPGMDGLEFTRALRREQRESVRKTPVILLTGEQAPLLNAQGLEAGADAFLRKPVTATDLRAVVAQYARSEQP